VWISKDILPSKTYRTIPPWLQNPTLMLLAHEWNGISNPFSKCLNQLQKKKIASSISFWPLNLSFEPPPAEENCILHRGIKMHVKFRGRKQKILEFQTLWRIILIWLNYRNLDHKGDHILSHPLDQTHEWNKTTSTQLVQKDFGLFKRRKNFPM